MGDEHGINSVEVTGEIPETCLSIVSAIYKEIKSIDAEQSWVSIAAGEYIKSRAVESYVTDHVWWEQQVFGGFHSDNIP